MASKRPRGSDGHGIVRLNVGGCRFDAARSTLARSGFFRACIGGEFAENLDDDGRLFVDRDGHLFRHVLGWMRSGRRPPENVLASCKGALLQECFFFGLPDLESFLRGQTCDFDLPEGQSSASS